MTFKKGDQLKCNNSGGNYLTDGKVYVAIADTNGEGDVKVVNDEGNTRDYHAWRFSIVAARPALDLTKPMETESGVPFTLITAEGRGEQPIMGYIGTQDTLRHFSADGTYYSGGGKCVYDLRNVVPKPKTNDVYANVYVNGDGTLAIMGGHQTLESAIKVSGNNAVGRVKVTLVEGQFAE